MMFRYAVITLIALLTYVCGSPQGALVDAALVHVASAAAASPPAKVLNAITVTNKSRAAIRLYPLQFGRPFIDKAIPHAPAVLLNGHPVPSQADVKNRYPDGSVEFAVIAVVVPDLQPGARRVLTFTDTTTNSNVPLTRTQMLDPSYNFDAAMTLTAGAKPPSITGAPVSAANQALLVNGEFPSIIDGGFTIEVNGVQQVVTGINLSNCPDNNCTPVVDAAIAAVIPGASIVATSAPWQSKLVGPVGATIGYASAPPTGTDLSAFWNWTSATAVAASLSGTPAGAGTSYSGDATNARTMLANGDYKLWTSGPVAQTVILADDSPARKYDIGFGPSGSAGGVHPFRPRYYATFWPATHQVFVRAVGENGNTTELEDLAYTLTVTGGQASPTTEESADLSGDQATHPKLDWAMSTWDKSFWLGGTPSAEVNIDNNLAYLESTRFVPNYDPSITLAPATVAAEYTTYWTNAAHDLYDAIWDGGAWTSGMSTTGARQDIGPTPTWNAMWLYTGDWRMRQLALGMADLAAAWPANLREGDPTKRLNRADAVPVSPAIGSGYGLPVSITDRKTLGASNGGEADFLYYSGGQGAPASDQVKVVGPLNVNQPWEFDASHEPGAFYIPYVLTGDPFYLLELENWAAYDATESVGLDTGNSQGRGPTGAEGGENDQLRGIGWTIRSRAEAAFAIPDSDPFKSYLTILTNEDIARWEGSLGVADPVFSGSPEYVWAQQTGDDESSTMFGSPPPPAGLGGITANIGGGIGSFGYQQQGIWTDANVSAFTSAWMQWYTQYALGRAAELGFAAGPLALATGNFLTGMINNSGYPELIASYELPVGTGNTIIKTWPAMIAEMAPAYLTSTSPSSFPYSSGQAPLSVMFKGQLYSQGYDAYASAALATALDDGVPGAAQAETWMKANIYQPLYPALAGDPSWAIVPRTDNNTLPAQPTR